MVLVKMDFLLYYQVRKQEKRTCWDIIFKLNKRWSLLFLGKVNIS